jgi:hypothetical protein
MKIWEPEPPGTLWDTPDCFTFTFTFNNDNKYVTERDVKINLVIS